MVFSGFSAHGTHVCHIFGSPFFLGGEVGLRLCLGLAGLRCALASPSARFRFAPSLLELRGGRGIDSAVPLNSATLHFAHGLRPMKKGKEKAAYVPARRIFFLAFFRTAHCLRGHYTTSFKKGKRGKSLKENVKLSKKFAPCILWKKRYNESTYC